MSNSIFPIPPRTQALFTKLSEAHYCETIMERTSRVEFALLEMCVTLERELIAPAQPAVDLVAADDAAELWAALRDLSFECDGVTYVEPPSRDTYNRTYQIMRKHQDKYAAANLVAAHLKAGK